MTKVDILRGGRLKVDDTFPPLRAQLVRDSGDPFNLDGFSVEFKMSRSDDSSLKVDTTSSGSVTVEDVQRGIVEYDWSSGDTDTEGTYELEFVADDGSGTRVTFPNSGRSTVYVTEGL